MKQRDNRATINEVWEWTSFITFVNHRSNNVSASLQ